MTRHHGGLQLRRYRRRKCGAEEAQRGSCMSLSSSVNWSTLTRCSSRTQITSSIGRSLLEPPNHSRGASIVIPALKLLPQHEISTTDSYTSSHCCSAIGRSMRTWSSRLRAQRLRSSYAAQAQDMKYWLIAAGIRAGSRQHHQFCRSVDKLLRLQS